MAVQIEMKCLNEIMKTKVIVTGDIHGNFSVLNNLINKKQPDVVICCGDFGYWPINDIFDTRPIKNKNTQIFWCPGNHENWDSLERRYGRHGRYPIEMPNTYRKEHHSNIFYCPIGSTLKLNGMNFLFVGGADSIDKNQRIMGYDWFPQEILNSADIDYVLENKEKIDVVISHTTPYSFDLLRTKRFDKMNDPSRHALSILLEKLKPNFWFAGHWHYYINSYIGNCKWTILDYPRHAMRWWIEF